MTSRLPRSRWSGRGITELWMVTTPTADGGHGGAGVQPPDWTPARGDSTRHRRDNEDALGGAATAPRWAARNANMLPAGAGWAAGSSASVNRRSN